MSRTKGYKCFNVKCGSCIGKTLCGEPEDTALVCVDRVIGKPMTKDEYIKKEAAIRALLNDSPEQVGYSREDAADCIRYMDAADVAPVRHGEWILGNVEPGYFTPGGNRPWICSKCKQVVSWSLARPEYNYCNNCGARMDQEAPHAD